MAFALRQLMESLLVFKAVTFAVIALCASFGLVALLISVKKERDLGPPLRGAVTLAFVLAGLCAALALIFAYQLQKKTSGVFQLERVRVEDSVATRGA